jgi:hypothetical protein
MAHSRISERLRRLEYVLTRGRSGPDEFNRCVELAEADARSILGEPGMADRLSAEITTEYEAHDSGTAPEAGSSRAYDEILDRLARTHGRVVARNAWGKVFLSDWAEVTDE